MKNVTLSVSEETLLAARRYASGRDTSLNRLVRDFLEQIARREDKAATARQRLIDLSKASKAEIGPQAIRREDLYDR